MAFTTIVGLAATNSSLSLTGGTTYYVTIRATNGAGLTTTASSDGVTVDTTTPTAGTVNDGAGPGDIDIQSSTTTIRANWSGFSDSQSGIAQYEWAIGTTSGGQQTMAFTTTGISGLTAVNSSLTLATGTTYYVTIRATNGAGLTTTVTSDGVLVDGTAPTAGIVNDGTGADIDSVTNNITNVSANWSGFSDLQSGISGYEMAIGTLAGAQNLMAYTSVGTSTISGTFSVPAITNGMTYYVTIRATNGAGLTVTASSDGVTVSTGSGNIIGLNSGGNDGGSEGNSKSNFKSQAGAALGCGALGLDYLAFIGLVYWLRRNLRRIFYKNERV